MSPPTPTRPESDAAPPPAEEFWTTYNAHFEFPIGTAASVLTHVLIVAALVFVFVGIFAAGKDTRPVSITSLGESEDGQGTPGEDAGGVPHRVGGSSADGAPQPETPQLAKVREELADWLGDLAGDNPIPEGMKKAYEGLGEDIRKKILNPAGGAGPGDGGTGADATRARGLRWVLRFKTTSGRDYLAQLRALKAVVMIPVPPRNDKMIILRDLGNPRTDEFATDADIAEQSNKIQFQDVRKESCEAIAEALKLQPTPTAFWAFFPKELETEMARLEVAYQNKRPEAIRETVFQVIVVGGEARLQVVAQKLK